MAKKVRRKARRGERQAPHLPEIGFVRQPAVLAHVPFSKSTLWAMVARGEFPKPLQLARRVTAWRAEDVRSWIASKGA